MATTAAFTSLSVPAPADTMEMSSPANRPLDEDIDIDFGDYQEDLIFEEDEPMQEDHDRPATATDDIMDDDPQPEGQVEETIMEEDIPQNQDTTVMAQEDEELIDYGEEEDIPGDITEIANVNEQPAVPDHGVIEEIYGEPEQPAVEAEVDPQAIIFPSDEVTTEAVPAAEPSAQVEEVDDVPHDDVTAHGDLPGLPVDEQYTEQYEEAEEKAAEEADLHHPEISVDTGLTAPADGPGTPTDTGLHPMTIQYGDMQIPLFKSRKQLDGLLKDDNLASTSLGDLIAACRRQLEHRKGEKVPESQELVLGFPALGLMLVEDSRAAFESSLNDVLDVYLQLHHNDGIEEIAPLALTLTPQLKFANGLDTFKLAAAAGQGISAFGMLHGHEHYEDGEEWQQNEAGDGYEHEADQEQDGTTYFDFEDNQADHDQAHDGEHHFEDVDNHDPEQDGYYQENAEGDFDHEDPDPYTGGLDDPPDQKAEETDHDYTGEEQFGIHDQEGAQDQAEEAPANEGHDNQPKSPTDHKEDATAGEYYEEDLIDWDDDGLTLGWSEETFSGQQNDTAFNTEYDTHEETGLAPNDQQPSDFGHVLDHSEDQEDEQHVYGEEQHYDNAEPAGLPSGDQSYDVADLQHAEQPEHEQGVAGDDGDSLKGSHVGEVTDEQYTSLHEASSEQDHHGHGTKHTKPSRGEDPQQQHGEEEEDFDDTVIIHPVDEHAHVEGQNGDEHREAYDDDLIFDDEDDGELIFDDEQPVPEPNIKPASGGSPLGKRSFDEVDELYDESAGMPEVKKVRSS